MTTLLPELPPEPTTQEVYEYIRAYFSRPGAKLAKLESPYGAVCVYRDEETGNKCAVGCLISEELYYSLLDEEYDDETLGEKIEGQAIPDICDYPQLQNLLDGKTEEGQRKLRFLTAAQKAHDKHAKDTEDLVRLLDFLADTFDLAL